MKKIITVSISILVLISIFTLSASALNIPKATSNFFVNDFANVISDSDEQKMQQQGEELYKACGAQVVVATVKSIDGEDLETYSLEMARSWEIGSKENDDGILLLLVVDDRNVRIEVGTGLEGALPDSKTGRLLDSYGIEHFKNNDFSTGLAAVYDSLVNEVYIENELQPADGYTPISDTGTEKKTSTKDVIIPYTIVALFFFLCFFVPLRKRRRGKSSYDYDDTYHGGFGGGFSGGSGGGGFSGGGGSFSGGGSSRGF